MFSKTRGRVDAFISDRVTAPVRTAVVISCAAFVLAVLALAFTLRGNGASR